MAGPVPRHRGPGRRPARQDDARGEGRPARQRLDRGLRRRRGRRPGAGRVRPRASAARRAHHARDRAAHQGVRHPPRGTCGRDARAGGAARADHGGEPVRHPRGGARGVPDRLRRLVGHDLPGAAFLGRVVRPRAGPGDGGGHRPDHARRRRPPGPRAGTRRDPRRPLGPGRGDDRRGPVPGRNHRNGLRGRPARGRCARDAETFRRVLGVAGRPQHGAGVDGPPGVRGRDAAAVRDGHPARQRPLGDAHLHRRRRRARERRPRAADPDTPRGAGLRRPGRLRLLRRLLPRTAARGRRVAGGGRRPRPGGRPGRGAAQRPLLRRAAPRGRGLRGDRARSWTGPSPGCSGKSASWACSTPAGPRFPARRAQSRPATGTGPVRTWTRPRAAPWPAASPRSP